MVTTNTTFRYPLDPTGVSPDNLVQGEVHDLVNRSVRALAPLYGAYFTESLVIRDKATGIELTSAQYKNTELLTFPTGRYGKEICGIILITDASVSNQVEIDYQVLGGEYGTNVDAIISMLNSAELDNRPVAWGDIISKPDEFTPAFHYHDIGDVYGFEYLVHAVERLREAILIGDSISHDQIYKYIDQQIEAVNTQFANVTSQLNSHIANTNNPHNTNKTQIGLGNVDNYLSATEQDATVDGQRNDRFMTPLRTYQAIMYYAGSGIADHIANTNNPHSVTKAQVGLGSVQNYPIATQAQAINPVDNNAYMTPWLVAVEIDNRIGYAFSNHVNNTSNPHNVTKVQIGLGSVQNYPVATQAQAEAGTDDQSYMTPLKVKQAFNVLGGAAISAHINNTNNPHNTTAAQVGLGNVLNYGVASQAQAINPVDNNAYMTPWLVAVEIDNRIGYSYSAHVANTNNPHNTTKVQVGLGNVQNYPIATQAQAEAGEDDASYMTPMKVQQAILKLGASKLYSVYSYATKTVACVCFIDRNTSWMKVMGVTPFVDDGKGVQILFPFWFANIYNIQITPICRNYDGDGGPNMRAQTEISGGVISRTVSTHSLVIGTQRVSGNNTDKAAFSWMVEGTVPLNASGYPGFGGPGAVVYNTNILYTQVRADDGTTDGYGNGGLSGYTGAYPTA